MAKYKSRAARASDAAGDLRDVADAIRHAENYEAAKEAIEGLDTGEIESLKEEMESWRDNTEEKFGTTDRWQRVSDAADALESVMDAIEGIDELTDPASEREDDIEAAHALGVLDQVGVGPHDGGRVVMRLRALVRRMDKVIDPRIEADRLKL